ncbi:hypothetical protein RFI_08633, partial [Reticulomyxa filosa]
MLSECFIEFYLKPNEYFCKEKVFDLNKLNLSKFLYCTKCKYQTDVKQSSLMIANIILTVSVEQNLGFSAHLAHYSHYSNMSQPKTTSNPWEQGEDSSPSKMSVSSQQQKLSAFLASLKIQQIEKYMLESKTTVQDLLEMSTEELEAFSQDTLKLDVLSRKRLIRGVLDTKEDREEVGDVITPGGLINGLKAANFDFAYSANFIFLKKVFLIKNYKLFKISQSKNHEQIKGRIKGEIKGELKGRIKGKIKGVTKRRLIQ